MSRPRSLIRLAFGGGLLLLVGLRVFAALFPPPYVSGGVRGVYSYSRSQVERAKSRARPGTTWPADLRRNASGSGIFSIEFDGALTVFSSEGPSASVRIEGVNSFLDERGTVKSCLPAVDERYMEVAPGGRYFLARDIDAPSMEIGECAGTFRKRIEKSLDRPRLFAAHDQLTILGGSTDWKQGARLEVAKFKRVGDELIPEPTTFLGLTGDTYEIFDYDPLTDRVLVSMRKDPPWLTGSSKLVLFTVHSGERTVLGSSPDYALFLKPEAAELIR